LGESLQLTQIITHHFAEATGETAIFTSRNGKIKRRIAIPHLAVIGFVLKAGAP
jgi:hypothetical protein